MRDGNLRRVSMHRRLSVATLAISIFSVLVGCGSSATSSSATTITRRSTSLRHPAAPLARDMGEDRSECVPRTVYFAYDDDRLDDASRRELQRAARCLRRGGDQSIHLVGSTDARGTEEYNLALGERRSRTVQGYLVDLGVDGTAVTFSSVGEELSRGEDEATMALDRHVETIGIAHREIAGDFAVRDELGAVLDAPAF